MLDCIPSRPSLSTVAIKIRLVLPHIIVNAELGSSVRASVHPDVATFLIYTICVAVPVLIFKLSTIGAAPIGHITVRVVGVVSVDEMREVAVFAICTGFEFRFVSLACEKFACVSLVGFQTCESFGDVAGGQRYGVLGTILLYEHQVVRGPP